MLHFDIFAERNERSTKKESDKTESERAKVKYEMIVFQHFLTTGKEGEKSHCGWANGGGGCCMANISRHQQKMAKWFGFAVEITFS